jgi:hypothetical protein
MKNRILFLVFCFSAALSAQDLANKVPYNAPFALCFNSKNLNEKVALKTIQEYPWVQDLLDKELKFLPKDLSQTGIDFSRNHYQYYSSKDSVMNYAVLIPLNNALQFEKLIQGKYGDSLKVKKQANYTSISTSKNHHLAWNDKFAIFVNATYSKPNKKYYSEPYSDLAYIDSTAVLVDSAATNYDYAEPVVVEEIKPAAEPKKAAKNKKSKAKKGKKSKKASKKTQIPEPTEEEIYAAQEKAEAELEETNRKLQEIENRKTDSIEKIKISSVVDLIFNENFNPSKDKATVNSTIFKNNDAKSDFYAFADIDALTAQFYSSFSGGNDALKGIYKTGILNSNYHINGYFEKDKIRLHQVITPKNDETKKSYQEMFDSKIDKNLLNYIGDNIMGYYSISIDTEAMINYEYKVLKSTLNSVYQTYMKGAGANEADVLIDAIAIFLDEKAIADLVPGNAVFVLHDFKKVQREYTSFTYDENYEQIETKGTKDEIQPNFTFLFNTRNEVFVDKLLKLPLKTNNLTGTDYQLTNGFYTIHFEKDNLLENLYFGLKNGVLMITTSKESVENLINQKVMPLRSEFKKLISKNNSSAWFDLQKIITASRTEYETYAKDNYWDIALKNAGEITVESKFKNGAINSELSYSIEGKHTNSLQYFFDVINDIYAEKQKETSVTE